MENSSQTWMTLEANGAPISLKTWLTVPAIMAALIIGLIVLNTFLPQTELATQVSACVRQMGSAC